MNFEVARRRRDPTVERLADLPNNDEIVYRPGAATGRTDPPRLAAGLLCHYENARQSSPTYQEKQICGWGKC